MIRKRLGRVAATLTTLALLGAGAIAAGPASAAQPGWQFINVQKLPPTVGDGAVAGYSFRIFNNGKSNISQLFLTDTVVAEPEFFWNSRGTVCQTDPDLRCSFGALTSKSFIDVIIAYRVGTSDFSNTFRLDSTGDPAGGNNSHGDSKLLPLTTQVSTNQNFDAGFVLDDPLYETTGSLGRQNKQTSSVEVSDTLIPVTIEDGNGAPTPDCDIDACDGTFGEWTYLDVPGNTNLIKATLNVWGGAVPGGVKADEIYVIHVDDAGVETVIDTPCSPTTGTPGNPECLTATKVGSNYRIVVWLFGNGNLRGGF